VSGYDSSKLDIGSNRIHDWSEFHVSALIAGIIGRILQSFNSCVLASVAAWISNAKILPVPSICQYWMKCCCSFSAAFMGASKSEEFGVAHNAQAAFRRSLPSFEALKLKLSGHRTVWSMVRLLVDRRRYMSFLMSSGNRTV
jgi:hypothetical protein